MTTDLIAPIHPGEVLLEDFLDVLDERRLLSGGVGSIARRRTARPSRS